MQYWSSKNNFYLVFLILFYNISLQAQENSPYSRYGIGNIRDIENVANRGMGGVSIADDNLQIANPTNPATYTGLKLASYQIGLVLHRVTIKSSTESNQVGKSTLSYVNIGFPISKKTGFSFGLLPVSTARYNMQTSDTNASVGSLVNSSYYGGGGIQKIYLGAAHRFGDYSIGFNTGYQFGNIINSSESSFTDSLNILSNNIYGRSVIGGVFWQVGGLMNKEITKDYTLKIGLTYTGAQKITVKKETFWESYFGDVDNVVSKVDSSVNARGKIQMPFNVGAGAILAHGLNWQIGADYQYSNWKSFTSFGLPDSLNNSWTLRVGGAYIPDANSVNSYWKKMTFRVGFYTGKDIYSFKGTQLSKTAGTAGIGYPIRRTNNTIGQINASVEVGSRGTTDNNLLKENFTHISLGFTFNDKWFLRRRYD